MLINQYWHFWQSYCLDHLTRTFCSTTVKIILIDHPF